MSELGRRESCTAEFLKPSVAGFPEKIHIIFETDYAKHIIHYFFEIQN